jgi:hypothetical protein
MTHLRNKSMSQKRDLPIILTEATIQQRQQAILLGGTVILAPVIMIEPQRTTNHLRTSIRHLPPTPTQTELIVSVVALHTPKRQAPPAGTVNARMIRYGGVKNAETSSRHITTRAKTLPQVEWWEARVARALVSVEEVGVVQAQAVPTMKPNITRMGAQFPPYQRLLLLALVLVEPFGAEKALIDTQRKAMNGSGAPRHLFAKAAMQVMMTTFPYAKRVEVEGGIERLEHRHHVDKSCRAVPCREAVIPIEEALVYDGNLHLP